MLDQLVTSLDISEQLKKLGLKQTSLFYWVKNKQAEDYIPTLSRFCSEHDQALSAWTAEELKHILPDCIRTYQDEMLFLTTSHDTQDQIYFLQYLPLGMSHNDEETQKYEWSLIANDHGRGEADACGLMLIFLLQNNLLNDDLRTEWIQ